MVVDQASYLHAMKPLGVFPLLVVIILTSCTGPRATVGEGVLLKRRLHPGWHVDLGLRSRHGTRKEYLPHLLPVNSELRLARPRMSAELESASDPLPSPAPRRPIAPGSDRHTRSAALEVKVFTPRVAPDPSPRTNDGTPSRRWNPWAVPAFVVALGTVAYALLGTSELIAVLAVIITVVMASIAVRQGRTNEWRGKGFAVAALMIGVLGALVTLIVLLAG